MIHVNIYIFVGPLFTSVYCIIYPQKRELSGEKNMETYIIEKTRKTIAKNCKSIFYETVEQE